MRDMKIAIIAEFFLHNPLTQVMYFLTSRYRHIPHESQKNPTFCCQMHIYNARIIQIHYYLRVRAHRGVSSYFIITRPNTSWCRFRKILSEKYVGISVHLNNFYENDPNWRNVKFTIYRRFAIAVLFTFINHTEPSRASEEKIGHALIKQNGRTSAKPLTSIFWSLNCMLTKSVIKENKRIWRDHFILHAVHYTFIALFNAITFCHRKTPSPDRRIGLHTSFPDRRRTCLHICDSATWSILQKLTIIGLKISSINIPSVKIYLNISEQASIPANRSLFPVFCERKICQSLLLFTGSNSW